jgi:hypothetical protein
MPGDRRQLHRDEAEVDPGALRPGLLRGRLGHEHDAVRQVVERQGRDGAGDEPDAGGGHRL